MKKKKVFFLGILVVIPVIVWLSISHQSLKPLATETVQYGNIAQTVTAIGDIEPSQTSTVKSQVAGIVKHIYYSVGDFVHKGDKLADLNPYPPPSTTALDLKSIMTDKATLSASQFTYNSYNSLYRKKLIPKNLLDFVTAKKNLAVAKAMLAYDLQKYQLDQNGKTVIGGKVVGSEIISPINGYILQKMINVGDSINSLSDMQAATPLFSIANMKHLIFKGSVDEIDASQLKSRMLAVITVAAYSKQKLHGEVSSVSLQSEKLNKQQDASSLTANTVSSSNPFENGFDIEVSQLRIPKGLQLRSGYSATASIVIKSLKHVLIVPERMLVFKGDKVYVNVPLNRFKSKLTLIKTGISDGGHIQIVSGLKLGDKIVDPNSSSST